MAFDPITFNEVLNSKAPIGSLVRVVDSFNNPRYVDTGGKFNINDYPQLGTQFDGGYQGDYVVEKTIINSDSILTQSSAFTGRMIAAFETNGKLNFFFARSANYKVQHYQTNSMDVADGINYIGEFLLPDSTGSETQMPIISLEPDGSYMYYSLPNRHYRFTLTDDTFGTYKTFTLPNVNTKYQFAKNDAGLIMAVPFVTLTTAGVVQRSTDDGDTWVPCGAVTNFTTLNFSLAWGKNMFVLAGLGTSNNVSRSVDGTTWTTATAGAIGHVNMKFSPSLGMFLASPAAAGSFYSSPDGVTWTARTVAANTATGKLNVTSTGGAIATQASETNPYPQVYTTTNGTTWIMRSSTAPFSNIGLNPYYLNLGCEAVGSQMFLFTTPEGTTGNSMSITSSPDNGVTWSTPVPLPQTTETRTLRNGAVNNDGTVVVVMESPSGTTGSQITPAMFKWNGIASTDGGNTWQKMAIESNGDQVIWIDVVPTYDNKLLAWGRIPAYNAQKKFVFATSEDGINWTYVNSPTHTSDAFSFALSDTGVMMTAMNTNTFGSVSTDGGATWISRSMPANAGKLGFFKGKFIYAANATAPRYSVNNGESWVLGGMTTIASSSYGAFASSEDVAVLTVYNSSAIYYTTDGATWVQAAMPAPVLGQSVAIVNGWVMVPTGAGSVYRTKDFKAWDLVVIGEDDKYANMTFTDFVSNANNTVGFFIGRDVSTNQGIVLRTQDEVTDMRRVPFIPSDIGGTKWVIIAK